MVRVAAAARPRPPGRSLDTPDVDPALVRGSRAIARLLGYGQDERQWPEYVIQRTFSRITRTEPPAPVQGTYAPRWRPAEWDDGTPRRLCAHTAARARRGDWDIAVREPGNKLTWFALDIDGPSHGIPESVATERLDRVCDLFGASVLFRTPGGGYHAYFPLTRPHPASVVKAAVRCQLAAAGLAYGSRTGLEVFPSGNGLRWPCSRGMLLLNSVASLRPVPGTVRPSGDGDCRDVLAMEAAFCKQWKAARRTLRQRVGSCAEFLPVRGTECSSFQRPALANSPVKSGMSAALAPPHPKDAVSGCAGEGAVPGDRLLYGAQFTAHCHTLQRKGVTQAKGFQDALLKLAFHAHTVGQGEDDFEATVATWIKAHPHVSSRSRVQLLREASGPNGAARRAYRRYVGVQPWRRTMRADGLVSAPVRLEQTAERRAELERAAPSELAQEVAAILRAVAAAASKPLSSAYLRAICGDRRLPGGRKRAYVAAMTWLRQQGVLEVEADYCRFPFRQKGRRVGPRCRTYAVRDPLISLAAAPPEPRQTDVASRPGLAPVVSQGEPLPAQPPQPWSASPKVTTPPVLRVVTDRLVSTAAPVEPPGASNASSPTASGALQESLGAPESAGTRPTLPQPRPGVERGVSAICGHTWPGVDAPAALRCSDGSGSRAVLPGNNRPPPDWLMAGIEADRARRYSPPATAGITAPDTPAR